MGIIGFISDINKSLKIDEQTYGKYEKSYVLQAETAALLKSRKKLADDSLTKAANRKRAILSTTMNSFLDVYRKIIKINFIPSDKIALSANNFSDIDIAHLEVSIKTALSPMGDKEIYYTYLKGEVISLINPFRSGLGDVMVEDSKRNLKIAGAQLKNAEVMKSQAETEAIALEAIATAADKIAALLSKLNLLFLKSVKYTDEMISDRGYDRKRYNDDDRKAIMTCMNLAKTVKVVIDAPVLDRNGKIAQAAFDAIEVGNQYINTLHNI